MQNQVAKRLDKFMVTKEVMDKEICIEAFSLPCLGSYHWPVHLEIDIKESPQKNLFHFENVWLQHPDFVVKSRSWWEEIKMRNKMHTFQLKLKELKSNFRLWSKK